MQSSRFRNILEEHQRLSDRSRKSAERLEQIRQKLDGHCRSYKGKAITIYCAGSLGRGDAGKNSDLDIFVLAGNSKSKLDDLEILASVLNVNKELGYDRFSNEGRYFKVYSLSEMLTTLGKPEDDSENLFTARMLLLLESQAVFNESLYDDYLTQITNHYFRDKRGKSSFRPLFLLNDLLRYWRTLCLNYEQSRDDQNKPWWKKNINLKFSRMITVFGTILPVIARPARDAGEVKELTVLTPLERFAVGLDILSDPMLEKEFHDFLDTYESFLQWKENLGSASGRSIEELNEESRMAAQRFSNFIYTALSHKRIEDDFKKYLVL